MTRCCDAQEVVMKMVMTKANEHAMHGNIVGRAVEELLQVTKKREILLQATKKKILLQATFNSHCILVCCTFINL